MKEALRSTRVLLAPKVLSESLFIYQDASRESTVQIDAAYLSVEGFPFEAIALTPIELAKAVRLAQDVDDGEAEALAIASERALPILTDDVAAIRLAAVIGVEVVTTLDVLFDWSRNQKVTRVKQALQSMRDLANYAPPRKHPRRAWYVAMLNLRF